MNIENQPANPPAANPPANPQPLWAGIQIPQFNPQPAGFGAGLVAQGQGQLIPPGLVINNPNLNPQGRKRKSRKQKSRKNSRKHKSNRR
jgi:hypothetical protein